jgi:hypothetical protein
MTVSEHLVLPDGWADLADPRKVPERRRRKVTAAMAGLFAYRAQHPETVGTPANGDAPAVPAITTEAELELIDAVNEAVTLAVVERWSFGDTVTADALLDLPGDTFDVLRDACTKLFPGLLPSYGDKAAEPPTLAVVEASGA